MQALNLLLVICAEDIKNTHEELYPEDGEIFCQRLMLVHGEETYALSTVSTIGGIDICFDPPHLAICGLARCRLEPPQRGSTGTLEDDTTRFYHTVSSLISSMSLTMTAEVYKDVSFYVSFVLAKLTTFCRHLTLTADCSC